MYPVVFGTVDLKMQGRVAWLISSVNFPAESVVVEGTDPETHTALTVPELIAQPLAATPLTGRELTVKFKLEELFNPK